MIPPVQRQAVLQMMICQTAEGILRKKLRVPIDKRDEIYTIKKDFNNLWDIMIYESNSGNCQKSSAGNDRHDGYQTDNRSDQRDLI